MMRRILVLCLIVLTAAAALAVDAQGKSTPAPSPTSTATPAANVTPEPAAMPALAPDYTSSSGALESDWERAVDDMRQLGLIDAEGELLFAEDMAIESLGTSGGSEATYVNTVMGALISVREDVPGTLGICLFITRGERDRQGNIAHAVGVLLTSDDEIYALEQLNANSEPHSLTLHYEGIAETLYNPVYVVVLVKDSALTLWVEGEVIIDAWELQGDYPDREYEIPVTTTVNPETGCVMTGLWAYGF